MEFITSFLFMRSELSLIAVILILLLYDIIAGKRGMKYFKQVAIILCATHLLITFFPYSSGESFGGM